MTASEYEIHGTTASGPDHEFEIRLCDELVQGWKCPIGNKSNNETTK